MSAAQIHARERAISHQVCPVRRLVRRHTTISPATVYQKPLWTHTPDGKPLHLHALSVLNGAQLFNRTLPDAAGCVVFSKKHGLLIVRCARDTLLGVGRVKSDGKKEMGAQEWWNGAQGTFCFGEGKKEVRLGGCA